MITLQKLTKHNPRTKYIDVDLWDCVVQKLERSRGVGFKLGDWNFGFGEKILSKKEKLGNL